MGHVQIALRPFRISHGLRHWYRSGDEVCGSGGSQPARVQGLPGRRDAKPSLAELPLADVVRNIQEESARRAGALVRTRPMPDGAVPDRVPGCPIVPMHRPSIVGVERASKVMGVGVPDTSVPSLVVIGQPVAVATGGGNAVKRLRPEREGGGVADHGPAVHTGPLGFDFDSDCAEPLELVDSTCSRKGIEYQCPRWDQLGQHPHYRSRVLCRMLWARSATP